MKRLVYFYLILILSGMAILSMGCAGGITTPGTGGGTGSAYTSYPMDISYAKNYIFPTDYGVMIVPDIPDGVDKINYYDTSTDTLIGSSSKDKEVIKYNTTDDEVRIKLVPVINGEEKEEYALISKVKRNQSEGIIYNLRFDPRDYEHLSITLVVKDEEAYNELFQDYNGQKIGKIQNEIEDIVEFDSTESSLPITFHKENIEPDNEHAVYYVSLSKGKFPLYIGYIPKMFYLNLVSGAHYNKEFTYAYDNYLVAHIPSIFFYYDYDKDPTYSRVNLSYPDEWKAIITYYNKGTFPEHSSDYTTYLMHITPTDNGLAIGDITLNAYTVTNGYTLYIGWLKSLQSNIDLSVVDKLKWMYKHFIEKIGMPEFDHRTILIVPSPPHGHFWHHPWDTDSLFIDVHGTIRLWLGGSDKFPDAEDARWIEGTGVCDMLYSVKYKVLGKDISEWEEGHNPDATSLPAIVSDYKKEVVGTKIMNFPIYNLDEIIKDLTLEEHDIYRFVKIRLIVTILDMLVHSTSGGKVTDLLEVIGKLYNGSYDLITNDDIFDAIADFTDYDFKPFINAYIYGTKPINADVKEKNGIYVTAISDYTTGKMVHIDTFTNNSATITGHADKDTFVTITCNKGLKNITVNNAQPSQTYTPWETEKAKAVSVPKGDYVINVSW